MTDAAVENRKSELLRVVKEQLPGFVEACQAPVDIVLLDQQAFAADYRESEYTLLGMAIKYAGLSGKTVHVVVKPNN